MDKQIRVDWHGPADLDTDFRGIPANEIDLYFYYNRQTGAKTCGASCNHCFLTGVGLPPEQIPLPMAEEITRDLREQGYRIGLSPADSLADDVLSKNTLIKALQLWI